VVDACRSIAGKETRKRLDIVGLSLLVRGVCVEYDRIDYGMVWWRDADSEGRVLSMANRWVGKNYEAHRLLMLGESAYSWLEGEEVVHPTPRHAEVLVELALAGERARFMKMLTRGVAGSFDAPPEQVEAAWSRVAFTNYVDGTVGIGARVRPSEDQWHAAAKAFPAMLKDLRPRNVIVLGKTMWSRMPDADVWLTDDVQGYRLEDRSVTMCWAVPHPAAGLSWQRLAQLIAYAGEGKIVEVEIQ
jgi:hypothetical protein